MIRLSSILAALLVILLLASASPAHANPDRVAPGHSGAGGGADCTECHFDATAKPAGEQLQIIGLPDVIEPGALYALTIHLRDQRMKRAGFQLSITTSAGKQAGTLAPANSVGVGAAGIAYMDHRQEGAPQTPEGIVSWDFSWTAPSETSTICAVVINLAANAANDDTSPFGDNIYLLERRLQVESANCSSGD